MKNVLIFGASIVHGVGGAHGGWADLLKMKLHAQLYGPSGEGETCECYELGVPGTFAKELQEHFEPELSARLKHALPKDTTIVISLGTNDAKAIGSSTNYAVSSEEFGQNLQQILVTAKRYAAQVIFVGLLPVHEERTNPKINPLTNVESYFRNDRLQQFDAVAQTACQSQNVEFISLFHAVPADWAQHYLFKDGIHPNDAGHQWIFDQVVPRVIKI
jgi:lysophospholipase L1-like esterase